MRIERIALVLSAVVMLLTFPGCDWSGESSSSKGPARESIFDHIVSIPEELVLDIPQLPPLCDEIKDLKKGYAAIKGGRLYYEEEGQGVPLVLISGGPGATHHNFHPYFSQIKDVARVIYYDQRGVGKSSKDDTGKMYTVKQAVEDLESLRKALNIEKWVVLGWSYGGLLAQLYALTYPDRCIAIVLIASNSGLAEPVMKPVRDQMFFSQAEQDAISNIKKMGLEGKITGAQSFYNRQLAGDWKHSSYYKPTKEAIIRTMLYGWSPAPGFEELMRPDSDKINLTGKFDDFKIPTLIFEGKWDLLWWNPDRAEFMRKNHPHAQVEIFEKSGHTIFADEPEKFFAVLRKFLGKTSTAPVPARIELAFTIDIPYLIGHTLNGVHAKRFSSEKYRADLLAFHDEVWSNETYRKDLEAFYKEVGSKYGIDSRLPSSINSIAPDLWHHESLQAFMKHVSALPSFQKVLDQTRAYKSECEKEWQTTYELASTYVKDVTGLTLDKKFIVYLTHQSMRNGVSIGNNQIVWGYTGKFGHSDVIYLWHEILHSYLPTDRVAHCVLQCIADNGLRLLFNPNEKTYPLVGHDELKELMGKVYPLWEAYLKRKEKNIYCFIEEIQYLNDQKESQEKR